MANKEKHAALDEVLSTIGLSRSAAGSVAITGDSEALLSSPHRLALGGAISMAAQAAGIAQIWKMRSGKSQDVTVDLRRAVLGLEPGDFLVQSGHAIDTRAHSREPLNGFYLTKDKRWFWVVGTYPHLRNGALDLLDCPNSKEAVGRAIAKWNAFELEDAFAGKNMVGAVARTKEEWRESAPGRMLLDEPIIRITRIGDSPKEPFKPAARPLSGLRVLDISHVIAGPAAARTLAEQGADVLRVSSPKLPDPIFQIMETGTGKRSAYIDLTEAEDLKRVRELVASGDVFIESWRPGCMDRKGLSPQELAKLRPGIIYVSVSCYGSRGPWGHKGGFDQMGQTATGVAVTEGGDEPPRLVPTTLLNDYVTGYMAAAGALAALIRRANEGGSYHVSVSLCRSAMFVQDLGLMPRPNVARPKPGPEDMIHMPSPFGALDRLGPVARYSETPAYWELPPQPLGASKAEWR